MSDGYMECLESDKKIVPCGTGYVVRITREMAMMGLNPGDVVHVKLTKVKGEDKNGGDAAQS